MKFLKLTGLIENQLIRDELSHKERYINLLEDIYVRCNKLYFESEKEIFLFVSSFTESGDAITFGIIASDFIDVKQSTNDFFEKIELELKDIKLVEITAKDMREMIYAAHELKYIPEDEDIFERFRLTWMRTCRGASYFMDYLTKRTSKKDVYAKSTSLSTKNTLTPELDRIYAVSSDKKNIGHPVHYIIQADDIPTIHNTYQLLLSALYSNNRISNRRCSIIDLSQAPKAIYDSEYINDIYESTIGGAVLFVCPNTRNLHTFATDLYEEDEEADDGPFPGGRRILNRNRQSAFEEICENIQQYHNKVLTILSLPRECDFLKSSFQKKLEKIRFIEIKEKLISDERAKEYLASLAKDKDVIADKLLFNKIKVGKEYKSVELKKLFDEWYDDNLRINIFPQYSEFAYSQASLGMDSYGNAYDQLSELIGLEDVKALILKILKNYKVQTFLADKENRPIRPSMHMSFTGNPGTAKTTVARLFAQIMRDNGFLPEGQIVECVRSDLVAKYVGATAMQVRDKFKEAKGGVLFIDEAYSLVDFRDGSFGDEAINTIVSEMENNRDDTIVVFAGYSDKMEGFLNKNQGLRSRISYHIHFADYSTKDLLDISNLFAKQNNLILSEKALEKLEDIFNKVKEDPDFGNGRYVRNILEQAVINKSSRLFELDLESISMEEAKTILAEDIEMPIISNEGDGSFGYKTKRKTIGF